MIAICSNMSVYVGVTIFASSCALPDLILPSLHLHGGVYFNTFFGMLVMVFALVMSAWHPDILLLGACIRSVKSFAWRVVVTHDAVPTQYEPPSGGRVHGRFLACLHCVMNSSKFRFLLFADGMLCIS